MIRLILIKIKTKQNKINSPIKSDSAASHLFTLLSCHYQFYVGNLDFNSNIPLYLYQFTLTHQGYETLF